MDEHLYTDEDVIAYAERETREAEEARADARVKAVAHELLAALEGIIRGIFDGPDESDAAMLVAKARAVIAKAKEDV